MPLNSSIPGSVRSTREFHASWASMWLTLYSWWLAGFVAPLRNVFHYYTVTSTSRLKSPKHWPFVQVKKNENLETPHLLALCERGIHQWSVDSPQSVSNTAGLDTYFLPNLAVGQPSNNMDLSEIEIFLGIIIVLFFFAFVMEKKTTNKSGRTYICLFFYYRINVTEVHCRLINHRCSCLKEVLFTSTNFDITGTRGTFQTD